MINLPKVPEWELYHGQEKFAIIPVYVYDDIVKLLEKLNDQNNCCPCGKASATTTCCRKS